MNKPCKQCGVNFRPLFLFPGESAFCCLECQELYEEIKAIEIERAKRGKR